MVTTLFASNQKVCHKDSERGFGVLQVRFAIVKNPPLIWDSVKISNIIWAYMILHNMIIEDERDEYNPFDVFEFVQAESTTNS